MKKCKLDRGIERVVADLAQLSRETDKEYGVAVCRNRETDEVYPKMYSLGDERSVCIARCNIWDEEALFDVHTHPGQNVPYPSDRDMVDQATLGNVEDMLCIVSPNFNSISCWRGLQERMGKGEWSEVEERVRNRWRNADRWCGWQEKANKTEGGHGACMLRELARLMGLDVCISLLKSEMED